MAVICGEGRRAVEPGAALCAVDRGWPGLLRPCCTPCAHMLTCRHLHKLTCAHAWTHRPGELRVQLPTAGHTPAAAFRLLVPPRLYLRPAVPMPSAGPISAGRVLGWGPWGGSEGSSGDVRTPPPMWVGRWGLEHKGVSQDLRPPPKDVSSTEPRASCQGQSQPREDRADGKGAQKGGERGVCLGGWGQPLDLRPWLGMGAGEPRCSGGGAPERRGHVARSAGSLPTSKRTIIPGRLASTGGAASPRPGSAIPSLPATLIRANCSDISALTGPGAGTSRTFSQSGWRWAAFPGLSPGGVRQEEAEGGQAAQVGSAPDPRGEGGMQTSVPAASDHRPRQRDTPRALESGGVLPCPSASHSCVPFPGCTRRGAQRPSR